MEDTPCGCELLRRAEREPEGAREQLEATARRCQRDWGCPYETGEPPPESAEALPPAAQESLEAVGRITGAKGLTTCPLYYVRLPWVGEACRARKWAERGELRTRYGEVSGAMCEAIDLVEHGIAARMGDDNERAKAKRKGGGGDGG